MTNPETIELATLGDLPCTLNHKIGAVVINYELFLKSIEAELRRTTADGETVNRQFDRAIVGRLATYYRLEFPDRDWPLRIVMETEEAPHTPWLGGFHVLRGHYIAVSEVAAVPGDPEPPELSFATEAGTPLEPYYMPENQRWWAANGQFVVA